MTRLTKPCMHVCRPRNKECSTSSTTPISPSSTCRCRRISLVAQKMKKTWTSKQSFDICAKLLRRTGRQGRASHACSSSFTTAGGAEPSASPPQTFGGRAQPWPPHTSHRHVEHEFWRPATRPPRHNRVSSGDGACVEGEREAAHHAAG